MFKYTIFLCSALISLSIVHATQNNIHAMNSNSHSTIPSNSMDQNIISLNAANELLSLRNTILAQNNTRTSHNNISLQNDSNSINANPFEPNKKTKTNDNINSTQPMNVDSNSNSHNIIPSNSMDQNIISRDEIMIKEVLSLIINKMESDVKRIDTHLNNMFPTEYMNHKHANASKIQRMSVMNQSNNNSQLNTIGAISSDKITEKELCLVINNIESRLKGINTHLNKMNPIEYMNYKHANASKIQPMNAMNQSNNNS
jgi:uncharacterized FlaG/YvyC family protein